MKLRPWVENICYPGTHWLPYNDRSDYIARVDLVDGFYRWEAFMFDDRREYGFESTLLKAQEDAEAVVKGIPYQITLL